MQTSKGPRIENPEEFTMRRPFGGEEGIRTLGTLSSAAAYQAAALSHSATSGQVLV